MFAVANCMLDGHIPPPSSLYCDRYCARILCICKLNVGRVHFSCRFPMHAVTDNAHVLYVCKKFTATVVVHVAQWVTLHNI